MTTHTAADSAKALRVLLKLTQQQLADASGVLSRDEIVKLESGKLKARTARTRAALAKGFGLPLETMAKLLDGEISAERAFQDVGNGPAPEAAERFVERPHQFASYALFIKGIASKEGANPAVLEKLMPEAFATGVDPGLAHWRKRYVEIATELAGERRAFREAVRGLGTTLEDDDAPAPPPRIRSGGR